MLRCNYRKRLGFACISRWREEKSKRREERRAGGDQGSAAQPPLLGFSFYVLFFSLVERELPLASHSYIPTQSIIYL
jgi:hypothetical protein